MALTVLSIEIANPANPAIVVDVELLVDSGAIYSIVPRPVLERLGIKIEKNSALPTEVKY